MAETLLGTGALIRASSKSAAGEVLVDVDVFAELEIDGRVERGSRRGA